VGGPLTGIGGKAKGKSKKAKKPKDGQFFHGHLLKFKVQSSKLKAKTKAA
jgi:hypothetical protein